MLRTFLWGWGAGLALVVASTLTPVARAADEERRQPHPASNRPDNARDNKTARDAHMEVPDDAYVPVPRHAQPTGPRGLWSRGGFLSVQVNVNALGMNIIGDAANEPSIAADPVNTNRIAIGWRQFDTITNNFRQAGWGYTSDGGQTWTFPNVIEPGVFRSDPVLDANAQGDFFYNSLTANAGLTEFWCHVYKSTDGGMSWDTGVYAYGGDKQWMTIDRTGGIGHDNIYAYWTKWYTCPGCTGHFTRSYDAGATFLPTIDVPGNPLWGTLAVGPDGELYVAGDGFTVAKSTTVQDSTQPMQWDFSRTVDLDGSMSFGGGPNPGGLLGQVWIAVDRSSGPTRGNVYLLCSVNRNSTSDPLDVMFSRSTDGGSTWSPPVRVNDDPNDWAYQWFGTMSVAPNGRIDVIWNDTRNGGGSYDSELYYSSSDDAGVTWSANVALSPSFDPHVGWPQQNKMGDYFDMVSDDLGADLAYAATFNGEQDVYYLRIGDRCQDAGTVTLDRETYTCESTASVAVMDCGLNTNDLAVESVNVSVDSDSEPGGEPVTLTETGPATARFEGSISLSATDAGGVLWVAQDDTVTVTYVDANDGEGGIAVNVTDTAQVDCTAPVISNVQTTDMRPGAATVTFNTDELSIGTVHYGLTCALLLNSDSGGNYTTTPAVDLIGLQASTTYFYAVEATDQAGNIGANDNGGSCYSFTTPESPAILLVDDDDNSPDVQSYYTDALDALALDYDVWDTNNSDNEPDAATLGVYEVVIWFTGDEFGGAAGPGSAGESALGAYLDDGRCLFINAQDYYYDRGTTSFMTDYLGMASATSDVGQSTVTGAGSVFGGMGPYTLSYPFTNYSDVVSPNGTAELAFGGDSGDAAIHKDGGTYRTIFWGFPWEAVASSTDRVALMSTILTWCGELTFDDCNGNDVDDLEDIAIGTSEDCDRDNVPDECQIADGTSEDCNGNGVPDECDISSGASLDTNGDGVPDECELEPPIVVAEGARYVAVTPRNGMSQEAVALLVTGDPLDPTVSCVSLYVQGGQDLGLLDTTPVFQTPATWGTVHVYGEHVMPETLYSVQVELATGLSSGAASATTWHWGDVDNNGSAGFLDILLMVRGFKDDFSGATLEAMDQEPCHPDGIIGFLDMLDGVQSFKDLLYSSKGCPAICP